MRVTPSSTLPCSCPAFRNTIVLCDGKRLDRAVYVDTAAGFAQVITPGPDGKYEIDPATNWPVRHDVSGRLEVWCKNHGHQEA